MIKVTKIGLLNFWLYDEEEFDFYGGNLILRGINGSGKSVTMQSFIPLILDGNKSPDRLDPFGSRERKIEDYILGDSESVQKEESTAYLYMETYNEENKSYLTVGLGFRGRKGKGVDSYGFALKDGKRIGKDFFLYKDVTNKIPLTKNELKARLGTTNEYVDTTKEYKEMVNRLLFGFPNLDTYDEFIKLLLQLRSNKLSKEYKPTNLVNVLNTVLQPLSEEDLRPLSDAIEQMNKTKEQIEILEKNHKILKNFLVVYKNYNEVILLTKARNYKKISDENKELKKHISSLEEEINNSSTILTENKDRYNQVIKSIDENNAVKKQLDNQDLKQKVETLENIKKSIIHLNERLDEIKVNLDKLEQDKISKINKIHDNENENFKTKKQIEDLMLDLKQLADEIYFDELVFFIDELKENIENTNHFEFIFNSLKNYQTRVNKIKSFLEEEQKINRENENYRIEFDRLTKEYNNLERDKTQQEKNLKESIMSWEEEFINKLNNNNYLKLNDDIKKKIFDLMNNYTKDNFDLVKNIFHEEALNQISDITKDNLILENKQQNLLEELKDLNQEYQNLKNNEDLDLNKNQEIDKVLTENNIERIPLYKCIEFKDSVSDNVKNKIESSLLELNILDALIIKNEDLEKINKLDIPLLYLTKTTRKKDNILKYFDINLDSSLTIKKEDVKDILESISTDKNDLVSIDENGISKIDFLNTKVDNNYKHTFIGYFKRLELKKQKLKKLEEKIEATNSLINNTTNLISNNNDKIEILKLEMGNLPSNNFINKVLEKISSLEISIKWNDDKQYELEQKLEKVNNELKKVKENINNNKQGLYIPLNLVSYQNVSKQIIYTVDILQNLKSIHNSYLSKLELRNSYKESLDNTIDNIAYLEADKQEKEKDLHVNKKEKETIEKLLETDKYKNQKDQLLKIESAIQSLTIEKEKLISSNSKLETELSHQRKELNDYQEKEVKLEKIVSIYEEIFLREYKLHYVYKEDIISLDNTIKIIIRDGKDRKEISLTDALSNFYSSFNKYRFELNDYSFNTTTLFNDFDATNEEVKKIYQDNTRVDVTTMYQGFKLNVLSLFEKLEMDINENKDLISKQDRHLFEDILLNTVGEKIRNKINSSNEWVNKINNIMTTMQKDSALSFRLVWKSIAANNEDEIDTKELVRILKMDPKLLKESDTLKLTNHFRSKIKKAEEIYSDSTISFFKIIEEILDYRTWFTFQLMYQRKGMNQKELTDKVFSRFSGGERAKSMYIPLFASVYAKLYSAKNSSLRLIALDEAFAGVDDDNIREMFGILKSLNINFIINSQILWGDYDTVLDLSICELIRPQNSSVVTVERYRWNGVEKVIIDNRNEYNRKLENA